MRIERAISGVASYGALGVRAPLFLPTIYFFNFAFELHKV